jgi:hypothetical protein
VEQVVDEDPQRVMAEGGQQTRSAADAGAPATGGGVGGLPAGDTAAAGTTTLAENNQQQPLQQLATSSFTGGHDYDMMLTSDAAAGPTFAAQGGEEVGC